TTVQTSVNEYQIMELTKLTDYTFQIQAKTATSDWTIDGPTLSLITPDVPQPVSGVMINTGSIDLLSGNKIQLIATVQPANVLNKTVHWSSSDNAIATVDSNGVVKG